MGAAVQRKNYRIDVAKLARARRALGTRTETETIHRALDLAADEVALAKALGRLFRLDPGATEPIEDDPWADLLPHERLRRRDPEWPPERFGSTAARTPPANAPGGH